MPAKSKSNGTLPQARRELKILHQIGETINSTLDGELMIKERAVGVINAYTARPHDFTKEEMGLMQAIVLSEEITPLISAKYPLTGLPVNGITHRTSQECAVARCFPYSPDGDRRKRLFF